MTDEQKTAEHCNRFATQHEAFKASNPGCSLNVWYDDRTKAFRYVASRGMGEFSFNVEFAVSEKEADGQERLVEMVLEYLARKIALK